MKIAHISDVHIRNVKYRSEYRTAFKHLYSQLRDLKPDIVINTGDLVHSKLAVSPELYDDVAEHMLAITEIAPYYNILGNHDLNLKNKTRTDAISPIVRALQGRTANDLELLGPGQHTVLHTSGIPFNFWNYDIRGHDQFLIDPTQLNVGLYHGSISGCVTDIGFVMEEGEAEIKKFDLMDFVLLGDIHKRQSFRNDRIHYPGSLVQQNYGEELIKGFLMWDIRTKNDYAVEFHEVVTTGRFHTIQVPANLDISNISVPNGSRIRAVVSGELTPSRRLELERSLIKAFEPIEVITPDSSGEKTEMSVPDIDELVGSRDKLMRDHLKERGVAVDEHDGVIKAFRDYEAELDTDGAVRGTTWKIKKFSWDNMLNYGDSNSIDLTKINGLVGIFAPNASGKSSIFDILLESLFDKISKDVPRNIDLVNDNKDLGTMTVDLESNGTPYTIERSIERIHYGQRKFTETKQWGKTSLEFSSVDETLNGTSRPETERAIRQVIGNFEDFALTTIVSQNPIFGLPGGGDLLNCRETDRRKILFRILDLDVYEQVADAARDHLKDIMGKFKIDRSVLSSKVDQLLVDSTELYARLNEKRNSELHIESVIANANRELDESRSEAKLVDELVAIEKELVSAQTAVLRRRALLKICADELSNMQKDHDARGPRPIEPIISLVELTKRSQENRRNSDAINKSVTEHDGRLRAGHKSLKTLDGIPCADQFPTCRFIADAKVFEREHDSLKETLTALRADSLLQKMESVELEQFDVVHRSLEKWDRDNLAYEVAVVKKNATMGHDLQELYDCEAALSSIQARQAVLQSELRDSTSERVKAIRKAIAEAKVGMVQLKRSIDDDLRAIGAIDASLQKFRADLQEYDGLKISARIHELVADMCGKNGLPYRILTMVLPVINAEIAKILAGIVKFSVYFEDNVEEQTVSLFIRYGDYKSRPLSLGSGAEKFISSLAIRVALLSVSSLPKTDILIIDEGFGKLDTEHLEALQRMFEYLKGAFSTVFVVSHVDMMRDIVDHSIEINSKDGYAHVEV